MLTAELPVFVSVKVTQAVPVLAAVLPKLKVEGLSVTEPVLPEEEVVTLTAALWPEVPAESLASTVKLYVVEAEKPLTAKDVPERVAIDAPFLSTV